MSIVNNENLQKLQCSFLKLTEANQQYVLGLAEGLKYAQGKPEKPCGKTLYPLDNGRQEMKATEV